MSFKNHNFGTNRIGGTGIGSQYGQGLYAESSTPTYPIGEKLELSDGRVFRYGKTAAAIAAGLLVSQDISATAQVETDNIVIDAANGFDPAAGSAQLQITLASITKDQFAGALLQTTDDAGEGYQYRIKSNSATDATTSGKVDIYLFDAIAVTLTTATDIAIVGGLWYDVVGATAATDYIIAGVTPMAFTSGYYGWLQTAGIATILSDTAIAIGDNLTLSDGTAGAVQLKDAETEPLVGFACYAPDDTGHVGVVLQGLVA
jgi:hypothetical protein